MNYYELIKDNLLKSEIYDKVKDYSKDRNKVNTYFETGKLLSEAGKEYGKNIIKQYSEKLMIEVGKKYNERNLRYMRKFYEIFSNIKWNPVGSKLCWSHYREMLVVNNNDAIYYYIEVCEKYSLTKEQLREKIKSKEYERLPNETKNKLITKEETTITDFIPNPIIIKNKYNKNDISEKMLKQLILEDIDNFLKELGEGFCYIENEHKIKIGDRYNYIDLLLFNYEYNSFVVVELKVTELKKEYIGQIQVYMNYIDKNIKKITHNKTIGLIICKKDNKFVIELLLVILEYILEFMN